MTRHAWLTLITGAVVSLWCGAAGAQVASVTPVVSAMPWFAGGGYGYYGGGTAAGNYFMGFAQVIRAEGEYNAMTAQGMVNFEEARSKYIDNVNRWTQAYFQMREANDAYQRQKFARNKHSPETLAMSAAAEVPLRPSSYELDPVTGKVTWPAPLLEPEYAALRADLEQLFAMRASSQTVGTTAQIHADIRQLVDALRSNIETMPANDFIAARKFLDALDYSIVQPAR